MSAKQNPPQGRTMTVPETAKVLGIGVTQAYAAVKAGQIPSIRIGGRIIVPTAQLNKLLGE